MFRFVICFIILLGYKNNYAQTCTELGQTPETAFPVCGTNVFRQENVPYCSSNSLYVPGCSGDGANYENRNPYFYKFTAYKNGPLSFTVKPIANDEDYDWQLFDVTGKEPSAIFTDKSTVVTGNWAGTYGNTGASSTGVNYIRCASNPSANEPTFAKSPELKEGHNYILMISHYTNTPSGYDLIFTEGTLIITDTSRPVITNAKPVCGGQQIRIKLNKKLKCASLAPDGSDFTINGNANIISAVAPLCNNGFDMDTILVNLDKPLDAGKYTLSVKKGKDGNTLLDYCDDAMAEGTGFGFEIVKLVPAVLDSVGKTACAPQLLKIYFDKPIRCNSLQKDGSNFFLTGPQTIKVTGATSQCTDGGSALITLQLDKPITIGGNYRLNLKPGLDGNTLVDECGMYIPLNNFADFVVADTVNATFASNVNFGCEENNIYFTHNGYGGVKQWNWQFNPGGRSAIQNPLVTLPLNSGLAAELHVSNGVCEDTKSAELSFDNYQKAKAYGPSFACPNEPALFTDSSIGNIVRYHWDFGNGQTSSLPNPPAQLYAPGSVDYTANVVLTTYNSYNCSDTSVVKITVVRSCFISVPSAFTPNGDGLNDHLYPLVAYKATDLEFMVFNRFGERVFRTTDWQKKWNGKVRGRDADAGTYVWVLTYTDDSGKKVSQKGTSILIR